MRRLALATALTLGLAGCAIQAPPQPQIPDETAHEGEHAHFGGYGIHKVRLDYVRIGRSERFETPIIVGLTVDNTCAKILSHSVTAQGRGINVDLTVVKAGGVGLRCRHYPTPIVWKGDYPFRMKPGAAYAVQVIVNGRAVGIVETRAPYPRHGRHPKPRIDD